MWHKAKWMGHLMTLKLTPGGLNLTKKYVSLKFCECKWWCLFHSRENKKKIRWPFIVLRKDPLTRVFPRCYKRPYNFFCFHYCRINTIIDTNTVFRRTLWGKRGMKFSLEMRLEGSCYTVAVGNISLMKGWMWLRAVLHRCIHCLFLQVWVSEHIYALVGEIDMNRLS